jgi:hypothetical protein
MKLGTMQSICQHNQYRGGGYYPMRNKPPRGKRQASAIFGIYLLAQLIAMTSSASVAGGVNVAPNLPPGVTTKPVECLTSEPYNSKTFGVTFCWTTYANATPSGKKQFISVAAKVFGAPVVGTPQFVEYIAGIEIQNDMKPWAECEVHSNLMTGEQIVCSVSGMKRLDKRFTVRVAAPGAYNVSNYDFFVFP